MTVAKVDAEQAKLAKRAEMLMAKMSNKHKREAIKFFDASYEDLDALDQMVLLASIADPSKTLEELDSLPLGELQKVILGE